MVGTSLKLEGQLEARVDAKRVRALA
ncbi:MAG TPA: hypothetical protein ENI60_02270, partial [Candidatus Fraserbacteria bacterium]|nr:hypothetical protein [Candidatus Fraserbacteria bacterium]